MTRLGKCINFYIGCDTNQGQLVGVKQENLLVMPGNGEGIMEYSTEDLGRNVFLYLQHLSDLSEDQSRELINKGIAIGRPNGYTFSNEGFFYLISLNVDLFGLIHAGYARNFNQLV